MKIEDALMFQRPSLELQRAAANEIARLKAALQKSADDNPALGNTMRLLEERLEATSSPAESYQEQLQRATACVKACQGYDTQWLLAVTEVFGGLPGYMAEIGAQNAEHLAKHVNEGVHELRDRDQGPSVADDVHERAIARIEFFRDDGNESVGMPATAFWQLAEADKQEGTFLARAIRERDSIRKALNAIMDWASNGCLPFDLAYNARIALAGEVKVKQLAKAPDMTIE